MTWQIHVFGVRHLSPMGAWHLREFLDRIKPDLVLIEGLADATELMPDVTRKETEPPIAILAYTDSLPVRTLVYPLARYSPEYQAMCWADEHDAPVEFIDLPSDVFLGLQDMRDRTAGEAAPRRRAPTPDEEPAGRWSASPSRRPSLYQQFADLAGEPDYETYWERHFEHNVDDEQLPPGGVRVGPSRCASWRRTTPRWRAENLVREAFMRRQIEEAIAAGHKPEKIVAVVGAFHAPGADRRVPGDDGRGAGLAAAAVEQVHADAVLVLQALVAVRLRRGQPRPGVLRAAVGGADEQDDLADLPSPYLSLVARHLREAGTHRSTAEVIEGVRLANTLSALKDGLAPTLVDLRDAAVTLIGHGELSTVQGRDRARRSRHGDRRAAQGRQPDVDPGRLRARARAAEAREVPHGRASRSCRSTCARTAASRRRRRRSSTCNRSSFFHRLRVLGVSFATPAARRRSSRRPGRRSGSLQWTPGERDPAGRGGAARARRSSWRRRTSSRRMLEACESIADGRGGGPRRLPVRHDEVDGRWRAGGCRSWPRRAAS